MGNISSACEGCFDASQKNPQSSPGLKKTRRDQTRDSTEDDLDKAEEFLLAQETFNSADRPSKLQKDVGDENQRSISLEHFNLIRILGQGAFGKVYLVQKKTSRRFFALKALKKKDLVLENLLQGALNERNILKDIKHPFIVQLKYSFQSTSRIYMLMDFCTGGDLCSRLKKEGGKVDEKIARFYAAEIILGIEYLHEKLNIIHRDIKPENILLFHDGHVKITDFGLAKTNPKGLTLCGTPDYLAPEVIRGRPYGQVVDWWSLGCLIYEMLAGRSPFGQGDENLIVSIMKEEPQIPSSWSKPTKDLISGLLKKKPEERLGFKGAGEIKHHAFFKDVNWNAVYEKKLTPPFRVAFTKQETPMHQKNSSNMSLLVTPNVETKAENKEHDHGDFPSFSYVAGDTIADHADLKTK